MSNYQPHGHWPTPLYNADGTCFEVPLIDAREACSKFPKQWSMQPWPGVEYASVQKLVPGATQFSPTDEEANHD